MLFHLNCLKYKYNLTNRQGRLGSGHKPQTQTSLYPNHNFDDYFFCGLGSSSDISIFVSSALPKKKKGIKNTMQFSLNLPTTSRVSEFTMFLYMTKSLLVSYWSNKHRPELRADVMDACYFMFKLLSQIIILGITIRVF